MANLGDQIDFPETLKITNLSSQNLTPEWRDALDELVTLVNKMSTELKALKDQVNGN